MSVSFVGPTSYVYTDSVDHATLAVIFEQCSENSIMGLIIGSGAPPTTNEFTGSYTWQPFSYGYDTEEGKHVKSVYLCRITDVTIDASKSKACLPNASLLSTLAQASLRLVISLDSLSGSMLHIIEKPPVVFPPVSCTPTFVPITWPQPAQPTKTNIPTPEEWQRVWSAWDLITLQMIPSEMLLQKPIDLRHKCLFYIGHIPTFLDMLLCKAIGGGASEPLYFWKIFERGIDPHVDDPDHCHSHSEVPEKDEDWPAIDDVIAFRDRVRARCLRLYEDIDCEKRVLTRNIARTLMMTLEHECFHIETLLYMLIQRAGSGTLPPPGFVAPPWVALSHQWDQVPTPSTQTVILGPTTLVMGHDDTEEDDFKAQFEHNIDGHEFGWDNESPLRPVDVAAFKVEWRPVTNLEFENFWRASEGVIPLPKSWVEEDGILKVKTMYGPIPMEFAKTWPVLTAYDDLEAYAKSKGGRLPSESELRLFLDTYEVGYEGGGNVGFRNWHPVVSTMGLDANFGKGSNGGVWEWSSTVFDTHDGLIPTDMFTGYSTDFFDTKHQVVLGSSYATVPRLERRTVRNFYQHNYMYPWVSARVVYDL